MDSSSEMLAGVATCIAGAVLVQVGYAYQKKSHNMTAAGVSEAQSKRTWALGFAVFLVGQIVNFASLSFSAQTLVSVLGLDFSLIANCIFAPLILKEKLKKSDVVATGIIVCGAALIVYFTSGSAQNFSVSELTSLFTRVPFIVLAVLLLSLYTGLNIRLVMVDRAFKAKAKGDSLANDGGKGSGSSDGHVKINTSLEAALNLTTQSAICSAVSYTSAKCSVQLVKESFAVSNQFVLWQTYVIIAVFVFAAVNQVRLLNIALKYGDSLLIIPAYYVINTILCIICGLVYFEEYTFFPVTHAWVFVGGACLTVIGIYMIAIRQPDDPSQSKGLDLGIDLEGPDTIKQLETQLVPADSTNGSPKDKDNDAVHIHIV